ncbi:hypothetical protein NP233_g8928 [Leucocoprinus birnbaumii]|uniref:Cytochrome P450 n=1 Tax=Leucocoprinus birnbaumii TaxID=56174 RepID=A0AAD5VNU8_9AGAR|nr:hypothetical protein NP233_g8928 [Leucocoprinus birnbaumii]
MSKLTSGDLGVVVSVFIVVGYMYQARQSGLYRLPPGPKKLPFIGNLLDMPSSYPWKTWAEWGKTYKTDILHLEVPGQSIIILNSYEAAKELLERRSAIYSSRPPSIMLQELSGFGFQFGMMPYGERWRVRRRLFQKYFNPSHAMVYELPQAKYVREFLHRLLDRPTEYRSLLSHLTGAISITMTYGVDVLPEDDPNLAISRFAVQTIKECLVPGHAIVDMVPMARYLPAWFPGAGFQKVAARSRRDAAELRNGIFEQAYKKWSSNDVSNPSFVSLCLDNCPDEVDQEYTTAVKDVAGNVYMAATDSTSAALETFILAMTRYPEIQKRAQREVDEVVGRDRLPAHADAPYMPYIMAIVKETLRWQATTPPGVPRQVASDDVYNGYFIPKDSVVWYNQWAMLNDEADYPEPREFRPERFLTTDGQLRKDGVRDPADIVFGFGRRNMSRLSRCHPLGPDGRRIVPTCEFDSGAIAHPMPFECTIKPRSREAVKLVQDTVEAMENAD